MAKTVVLTAIAEHGLEHVIEYLADNWGTLVCDRFLSRFEEVCGIISSSPGMFPLIHKRKKIRKCVLTGQNTIYYRETATYVEVLTIFDTRQDPKKLSALIKAS